MKPLKSWLVLFTSSLLLLGACEPIAEEVDTSDDTTAIEEIAEDLTLVETAEAEEVVEEEPEEPVEEPEPEVEEIEEIIEPSPSESADASIPSFEGYKLIEVDGGNLSGHREPNVVVDIGFGDREYWAFTNEHGQLVKVVASQITLQDDNTEPVKSNGRYYHDEAKVPGTERSDLDEGHVIADSLGGVANAYNITPQDSTLNRHGDQAYMERVIRDAGGATDFEAIITYPDTSTHIPSSYKYTYTVRGNKVVDEFVNGNPDKINEELGLTEPKSEPKTETKPQAPAPAPETKPEGDLASVDANGNGKVTIQEAKDAGYKMPIMRGHWLYQYMDDRDGDGMVGE